MYVAHIPLKTERKMSDCREVSNSLKAFLQIVLFVLFFVFFGVPAVQKYKKKDTIIVTSEEDTDGIEAPAVTFTSSFFGKVGWKSLFENASVSYMDFRISDHCKDLGIINECIEKDTFSLSESIIGVWLGPLEMNNSFWMEDLTYTSAGRFYTFKINRKISHADDDYLNFVLNTTNVAAVHVHDEKYFLMNSNPLGPPLNTRSIFPGSTLGQYQVQSSHNIYQINSK